MCCFQLSLAPDILGTALPENRSQDLPSSGDLPTMAWDAPHGPTSLRTALEPGPCHVHTAPTSFLSPSNTDTGISHCSHGSCSLKPQPPWAWQL